MTASKTAFVVAVAVALAAISSEAFVAPGGRLVVPTAQDIAATATATRLYAATASGSGLYVIDSWKLLPDGRIQGVMAGSGDKVLTSPLKNQRGLKPDKTVRTVSGSRYKLGTPAVVANASGNANKGMSVAQMGTPRATQAGIAGGVRATQPLNKSSPTASQDRVLNEYVANKGRATMPIKKEGGEKKKPDFLTPLIAGASSIAVGAAIGNGVVTTKGIDLEKLPDPSKVLESTKSLKLPDIKALQAPAIPSPGISLPKFEAPKVNLPEVALPSVGVPELKLPGGGIKLPEAPDGVKNLGSAAGGAIGNLGSAAGGAIGNLGSAAGGAIGNALENNGVKLPPSPFAKKQVVTPIMEPYRVPMPYLDQKVVQAKKEAAEREEAARIEAQRLKEDEELYSQARERALQEINAQQAKEREMALQQRAEQEARIRIEAEERVQKAEQEAAKLRTEVEQSRLALMEKERAAAAEAARLKAEAAAALEKERAAKEEFTKKLQAAELAELQNAADFSDKLAAAQEAAVKERSLAEETATKQKLAEEAATREVAATEEVRKISVGATAARKASYGPKLGTYEAWQERQRSEYQTRVGAAATEMKIANRGAESPFTSPSTEKLSTYQKWQRSVIASQVTSLSADSVTAAYATGAPAPVANQLVSGSVKLSEAGTVLNGDLGYTIAGSAALVGGITYAYNYQRVEDELEQLKAAKPPPVSQSTVPPPPPPPPKAPPVVPATPVAKKATPTSVTMAIQSKEATASVTKPIPPPQPPKETAAAPEVVKPAPAVSSTPEAVESGASYLESMSTASAGSSTKTSYSPFSNTKKYVEPSSSGSSPQSEAPRVPDSSDTLVNGASYLDSMTGPKEGLKASYSPFGKPKATTNDSLYSAPAVAETQVDEPAAAIGEVPGAPVNGGESYLDAMGGTGGASVKASYSPFGQPKATTNNDSLYSAPAVPESQPVSDVAPSVEETAAIIEEVPETPVNGGGSYLDSFGGAGDASVKASYSPFGQPKAAATNNDSLYSAPAVAESQPVNGAVPHVEEVPEAPVNGGGSYLDSMGGAGGASVKASYSPFGSSKTPTQTQGDSLYGPPGTTNQESSAVETPATDDSGSASQGPYLDDLKSDSTGAPVKTSYSPFGTKPKAASDNTLYSPGNSY